MTVRLGERFLPLVSVSPDQITAQLPSDVEPGPQELTVRWEGKPETTATTEVVRNAPGLFVQDFESQTFAAAAHADGSLVTPAAPARPEELITLYGTGLGPYVHAPLDGFAVPAAPSYALADAVEVLWGESVLAPESALAAEGKVGIVVLGIRVPASATGSTVEWKIRVNGRESNTVTVPVQVQQ